MSLTPRNEIGRYRVVRSLGQGGMGTLYLAHDPAIGRLVAIKLLREGAKDPELRERFTREAHSAGRLRHPNIVTIFDVGEHAGEPYIAMEYIESDTLAELIRQRTELPLPRKIELMEALCAGLHYAHKAGVIHRDIKPANIMIDRDGVLKILDFGIARLDLSGLTGLTQPGMTQTGMLIGTLNYMAPEQMAGKPVDARADMFSVGAVFYELLSYHRAFPGTNWQDGVLHRIMSGSVEPLEKVCPTLDAHLIAIVNRCLEKEPDKRYPDMEAVRRELAQVGRRGAVETQGSLRNDVTVRSPAEEKPSSGTGPTVKVPRTDSNLEQVFRARAQQIQTHIEHAYRAFEQSDFDGAIAACHQVLMLAPENKDALQLEERARVGLDERLLQVWLADARAELDRGALSSASLLVERALALEAASPEALALRQAVEDARRGLAEAQDRKRGFESAYARAQQGLTAGLLDSALLAVDEALKLDGANVDAQTLKTRILSAMDTVQEDRALAAVRDARQAFAAGNQATARAMLERFLPPHALVTRALLELQVAAQQSERRAPPGSTDPTIRRQVSAPAVSVTIRPAEPEPSRPVATPPPHQSVPTPQPQPVRQSGRGLKLVVIGAAGVVIVILGLVFGPRFREAAPTGDGRTVERPPVVAPPPPTVAPPPASDEVNRQRLAEARNLLDRGDVTKAASAVEQILAVDPNNRGAIELRAKVTEMQRASLRAAAPAVGSAAPSSPPRGGTRAASGRVSAPSTQTTPVVPTAAPPVVPTAAPPVVPTTAPPVVPTAAPPAAPPSTSGGGAPAVPGRANPSAQPAPAVSPLVGQPAVPSPPPAAPSEQRPVPPPERPQTDARGREALDAGSRLENAGDLAAALQQYERARQVDPSLAGIADQSSQRVRARMKTEGADALRRAKQYDALNRVAEAITWYERAYRSLADEDPDKKGVKDRLDVLRAKRR